MVQIAYICTKYCFMEQLSRHIERLLLKHNCVIVPGIGGFVAQYAPARYIAEEQLFLPPYRNVGFNPLLTINDGLLTQSYMTTNGISYTQGVQAIAAEVSKIRETLDTVGEVEFFGIGILRLTAEGTYDFDPISGGIASPSLYALDALSIAYTEREEQKEPSPAAQAALNENNAEEETSVTPDNVYVLRINKQLMHHIAAAVVAIVIYMCWTMPLGDIRQSDEKLILSSINKDNKNLASDPTGQAITHLAETITEKKDNILKKQEKMSTSETISEEEKTQYTIVLISAVSKKNAERFVQSLNPEIRDHVDVIPMSNHNSMRIIYGKYKTENEAYTELRQLRSDKFYQEAWIMHL